VSRKFAGFGLVVLGSAAWLVSVRTARSDAKQDLASEYVGKQIVLRNLYSGAHLTYDANGKLTGVGEPGMWALDSAENLAFRGSRLS